MNQHLSDQEIIRREKLKQLEELGIDPYPAAMFEVNVNSHQILSGYNDAEKNFQDVRIAGRLMSIAPKGKVTFAKIQDEKGKIQLYLSIDNLCPGEDKTLYEKVVLHLLDIGDFIGVRGEVFITRTGEITIRAKELKLLSKALRPLPIVKMKDGEIFDAFNDPEQRYRQRYVDLVVNPQVKETFLKRTHMIQTMRDFLNNHGALEVDTPVLQNIPGGAAAKPFITHHNTLDVPFYLRIANELYLKRLIVGGFDFVYEFSRNFRNEGMDRTHNPEFTVLEFYVAYKDYFWMMDFTEQMMEQIAIALHGTSEVQVGDKVLSFKAPFKRVAIYDAIKEYTDFDVNGLNEAGLRDVCKQLHIETDSSMGKGKLIDEIFGSKCERHFVQPCFIIDYPC
jgi:lysyl-tRNA synthetase class 2